MHSLDKNNLLIDHPNDRNVSISETTNEDQVEQFGKIYDFCTILTFISGAIVGNSKSEDTMDTKYDCSELPSMGNYIKPCGTKLDDKQYVAFKVLCCLFFLSIVINGTDGDSNLSRYLNASLNVIVLKREI